MFGESLQPKEYYDGPPEKTVPPLKDRNKLARPAQCRTLEDWKNNLEEWKKLKGSGWGIVEEIEDPRRLPKKKA